MMRGDDWMTELGRPASACTGIAPEGGACVLRKFLAREAAALLNLAIGAEFDRFLGRCAAASDGGGRRTVVRNGYQPERAVMTQLGPLSIRLPKARSRGAASAVFRSMLVRPYSRRAHRVLEEASGAFLQAWGEGDVQAALAALLGREAAALPTPVIRHLETHWREQHRPWLYGPLDDWRWESLWFDRVSGAAYGGDAVASLVVVGDADGAGVRLMTLRPGAADSIASWTGLLRGLCRRGLRAGFRWGQGRNVAGDIGAAIAAVYRPTGIGSLRFAPEV